MSSFKKERNISNYVISFYQTKIYHKMFIQNIINFQSLLSELSLNSLRK